jgi:hypothetical protein
MKANKLEGADKNSRPLKPEDWSRFNRVFGPKEINDIKEPEDVFLPCARKAWKDIQYRTLKGRGNLSKKTKEDLKEKSITLICDKFKELIKRKPDQETFDKWHKDACDKLIALDERWKQKNYPKKKFITITYGHAQKWFNMTSKYAYAYGLGAGHSVDVKPLENYHKYAHAPIDSYILKELGVSGINWTQISSYDKYMEIQNKFKGVRLDAELRMWDKAKG